MSVLNSEIVLREQLVLKIRFMESIELPQKYSSYYGLMAFD